MDHRTHITIDGGQPVWLENLPDTAHWNAFAWSRCASLSLSRGKHTLRWTNVKGGGLNLDAFALCDDPEWKPVGTDLRPPRGEHHLLVTQCERFVRSQGKHIAVDDFFDPSGKRVYFDRGAIRAWPQSPDKVLHIFMFEGGRCSTALVPVAGIDEENSLLTTGRRISDSRAEVGARFFVDNVREALDSPGEWYLDRTTGTLTYWPTRDDFARTPAVLSVLDRLVELNGNPQASVEYTDKLVGRLVAAVEKLGLRERTIIFYAGDNGPAQSIGPHGKPVDGGKGYAVEEGGRVPMIVNCPGVVRPIGTCGELVDFTDLFPTLVELASGKLPANYVLDGRSFAPLLLGQPFSGREWVYSPLGDRRILRDKHWLYEGDARYFYCNGHRNGYREVTDSQQSDAANTRQRFEKILGTLPTPGKQGAPDIDWADYRKWEQWILKRVPSYSIVAYKDMKRPPRWFIEKYPQWFPDYPAKAGSPPK